MTEIGIFEPSWHPSLIRPLAEIANHAGQSVTVFTTAENVDRAGTVGNIKQRHGVSWASTPADETNRSLFGRVEQASAELDFLWLVTPYGSPKINQGLLRFDPDCPLVISPHATTRFVDSHSRTVFGQGLRWSVKRFGNALSPAIRNWVWNNLDGYLNPALISHADLLLGLYPPVQEFIQTTVAPDTPVAWFLPEYHDPSMVGKTDRFRITIPGRIKKSIREYEQVFDIMDALEELREELSICMLGCFEGKYGQTILSRCMDYKRDGWAIRVYPESDWIPASEFTEQLRRTDLIFSPDRVEVVHDGRTSHRGTTKTIGAIGDAVRSGTPLLVPEEFPVAEQFKGLLQSYEKPERAAEIITELVKSPVHCADWKTNAQKTADRFSLEQQATRYDRLYQQVINTCNQ